MNGVGRAFKYGIFKKTHDSFSKVKSFIQEGLAAN